MSTAAIIDDLAPGKHVKLRGRRYFDGVLVEGHHVGVIREVKRDGDCIVLESGWHMHLDGDDELIWCADRPAPGDVR